VDDELTDGMPNETNNQLAKRLFESRLRRAEFGEWITLLKEYVQERCQVEMEQKEASYADTDLQDSEERSYVRATHKLNSASVRAATNLLQAEPRAPPTQETTDEVLRLTAVPAEEAEQRATAEQCKCIRRKMEATKVQQPTTRTIKAIARHLQLVAEPEPSGWRTWISKRW